MSCLYRCLFISCILLFSELSYAYFPSDAESSEPSLVQRVQIVERRLDNRDQQHISEQLRELQHQVEVLQGQLEMQKHVLTALRQQNKTLYLSFERRLAALKATTKEGSTQQYTASSTQVEQSADQQGEQAYQAAFNMLQTKQYPSIVKAFKVFIGRYPNSQYVANAYYWLGQVYQIQGQLPEAVQSYELVVKRYPSHSKTPDALYKLAMLARQKGDFTQFRHYLNVLLKTFPNHAIAGLAKAELKKQLNPNQSLAA